MSNARDEAPARIWSALRALRTVMFVCGDEESRKASVLRLASELGFEAIDAGKLTIARLIEPYACSGSIWR